jgi:hypothetical protein
MPRLQSENEFQQLKSVNRFLFIFCFIIPVNSTEPFTFTVYLPGISYFSWSRLIKSLTRSAVCFGQGRYIRVGLTCNVLYDSCMFGDGLQVIHYFFNYPFINHTSMKILGRLTLNPFDFAKLFRSHRAQYRSPYWLTHFFDLQGTLLKRRRQTLPIYKRS